MEYERIHKPQNGLISPSKLRNGIKENLNGLISPSKLRMKLIGPLHQRKKDGSNSNSARTSPAKLQDADFVKSSLLATHGGDFDEGTSASTEEISNMEVSVNSAVCAAQVDQNSCQPMELIPREDEATDHVRVQLSKNDSCNSSSVHSIKANEDEYLDYDSTSSFEFHKGDRSLQHRLARSFSRPMSSKWNDAEKWIMSRPNMLANHSRKSYLQNQANRAPATNFARVAPEYSTYENKLSVKRVDFFQPALQTGPDKFAFVPSASQANCIQGNASNTLIDLCPESQDLKEVDNTSSSCGNSLMQDTAATPAIRSVSMRDMGTEMTPIPSQEPSRTASPLGATTPIRSPTSSVPSTPRGGEPAPTPTGHFIDNVSQCSTENGKNELSEQELKLKTRREIVALGVQLGKMNIAAWASNEEKERSTSAGGPLDSDETEQIEFANRAAAWEEAEKSKHTASFKREEIKIQAWESQQKAKLEAEMRRIEAQVQQMRAQAQAKIVKKIAMARQKSEEMRAAAEARKKRQAEKVAGQAEYIRQTGRLPSSSFVCCGWSQ